MIEIRCYLANCVYHKADNTCDKKSIVLDEDGCCQTAAPAVTCGDCAKFGNRQCWDEHPTFANLIVKSDWPCKLFAPKVLH